MSIMDERARAILQEAADTIERVEREQAERAPERERREAELLYGEKLAPPAFSSHGNRTRTRAQRELIYKTTQQPEPKAAIMDAETLARWNAWADAKIHTAVIKGMEELAAIMGEEAARQEKRLMAVIETLREGVRAASAKNITPLRARDVA